MSKFHLLSDLHLEFGKYTDEFPDADYLLLAGDATVVDCLHENKTDKSSRRVRENTKHFFERANKHFKNVFYCFGNHEHYRGVWNENFNFMKNEFLPQYENFMFLEKDHYEGEDFVLLGTTLWASFNEGSESSLRYCKNAMNDFHLIQYNEDYGRVFTPYDCYKEHMEARNWLENHVKKMDKKVVVMSHHAPSKMSTHPKYAMDVDMNGAYSSNLEYMMENVDIWVHGHTHESFDYMIDNTRVVCNPRGYEGNETNYRFNPGLVIEV